MIYEDGSPHTSHTSSPVPFALFHKDLKGSKVESQSDCALKDVSPTVLEIMGEEIPDYFQGISIFK
jgi:2,3-bisphosphoglycerate-independent phosphoglycerate mutase